MAEAGRSSSGERGEPGEVERSRMEEDGLPPRGILVAFGESGRMIGDCISEKREIKDQEQNSEEMKE